MYLGELPLSTCGEEYYRHPESASGGPFFSSFCYERMSATDECLAATDPPLRRALAYPSQDTCVSDGPYEQKRARTSAPICCYNIGSMGIGRPLRISARPAWAPLRRTLAWS